MANTRDEVKKTKRLMRALLRMKPKLHSEMKLSKPKSKRRKRSKAKKAT
jgi:hypothetical protein